MFSRNLTSNRLPERLLSNTYVNFTKFKKTKALNLVISTTHVDYQNKKMNVKLAAQVLSSSVADAIDFLRLSGNLSFLGSEPTVEFIKMVDRLFDLMNSKSPFGRGFKSPLSEKNKAFWEPILKESKYYLLSLTIDGKNILSHGRKTFALGFLMGIENFPLLLNALIKCPDNPIKYLLTFKCSQDNLGIFFPAFEHVDELTITPALWSLDTECENYCLKIPFNHQ